MLKTYKRKSLLFFITIFLISSGLLYVSNIKTTYLQGINYEVHSVEIPLYFKLLAFINRHVSYKLLAERIINNEVDDEKTKVLKLFKWTNNNIRKVPEGFPIVDDHAWHIIIRGYGTDDQSADVFTVLCNYSGFDAFFSWSYNEDKTSRIPFSFVFYNNNWVVFDSYHGNYFIKKKGDFASTDDIKKGDWTLKTIDVDSPDHINYSSYVHQLSTSKEMGLQRSNIQSPLNRFLYAVKRLLK